MVGGWILGVQKKKYTVMNLNKNYYQILSISSDSDASVIKKSYYKLSFSMHPDKGGDPIDFAEITEAYDVLCSELREEYDKKSKFGKDYNEYYELFDINIDYDYQQQKTHFETFKKNEVYNIRIELDDRFDGNIEYERWVKCKSCDGTGKDFSSKIIIRDTDGNVVKTFDADDGCDFCEGTGKDYTGGDCNFCQGKGKVGINHCNKCNGEKRILGKQKITKIKLTGEETKIESMGHCSKTEVGKVGYLLLVKK
jgi:DnaJ family protein A protein 2